MEEKFGFNGMYLIDFYHLCEYLSAAAPYCAQSTNVEAWLKTQKDALKSNQHTHVLHALHPYLENQTVDFLHNILNSQKIRHEDSLLLKNNSLYLC